MLRIPRIDARRDDPASAVVALRERLSPRGDIVSEAGRRRTLEVFGESLSPAQVVDRICRDVRERGLPAVLDYSARIDKAPLTADQLRVPAADLAAAHRAASRELLDAIRSVRRNIREFQQAILHRDVQVARPHGSFLRQRYRPLARVGICVPGGAASYPSTLLMTVVPAQVAGVRELAVVAPPTPFGAFNDNLLAACHELEVTEVYRLGGAQAVAALAYGVDGIPRVDKIVGPGNLFVALAKKYVYGEVDIDAIAGPSELVIVADESARPEYAAADMIAQAEHSPGASILIAWRPEVADAVLAELERQLPALSRGDLARESLEQFGAMILAPDREQAARLANLFAPEHLHLAVRDPEAMLEQIPCAGAAFLGEYSPVAAGDYAAGPSHVLPTSGTARFASGLSANDFLRRTSVIGLSKQGLEELAPDIRVLADAEGLSAHRVSVDCRLMAPQGEA